MKRRSVATRVAGIAFALAICTSSAAQAQPGAEDAIARGRVGVSLYERGEWEPALRAFREADAMFHSPVLTLYAARSLRNLGRLLESRRVYETLSREVLDVSAPRTWSQAQLDGTAELKALEAEIPRITLGPRQVPGAVVRIDGAEVALEQPIPLDPGEHVIEVTTPAYRTTQRVRVRRGEGVVHVELATPAPRPTDDEGLHGPQTFGLVLAGVGVAAFGAGAVVGIVALEEEAAAEEALPRSCTADKRCLPENRTRVEASFETSNTLGTTADALFISGGAAFATGLLLFLIDPGGESGVKPSARGGATGFSGRF